jgi:hypothetical protein
MLRTARLEGNHILATLVVLDASLFFQLAHLSAEWIDVGRTHAELGFRASASDLVGWSVAAPLFVLDAKYY